MSFESLWRSFASEMQSTETLFVGEKVCTIKGAASGIRSKARNFPTRFFLEQNLSLTWDISDSENSKKFCLIILKFREKFV